MPPRRRKTSISPPHPSNDRERTRPGSKEKIVRPHAPVDHIPPAQGRRCCASRTVGSSQTRSPAPPQLDALPGQETVLEGRPLLNSLGREQHHLWGCGPQGAELCARVLGSQGGTGVVVHESAGRWERRQQAPSGTIRFINRRFFPRSKPTPDGSGRLSFQHPPRCPGPVRIRSSTDTWHQRHRAGGLKPRILGATMELLAHRCGERPVS